MLTDLENLDIMLGGKNLDREEGVSSRLGRRPENPSLGHLLNHNGQSHSNSREAEIRSFARKSHSAREVESSSEFNR